MPERPRPGHDDGSADGEKPELAVVVVAFGAPGELDRCLRGVGDAYRVLVVDNSSSPEVAEVARRHNATYRDSGANLGFAAGVNRALDALGPIRADVLLLNPDAVIAAADVGRLQRRLRAAPDLACVAPAQRHPSGTEIVVRWPFAAPTGAWREAVGLAGRRQRWDFVIGSVLLLRFEALADVGRFDERFFLYGEEADWERRAVGRGWRIGFCPEIRAVHVGAATETDDVRHQLRFHAGVEVHVRKWHGRIGWRSYQLATVLTALRRGLRGGRDARHRSFRLAGLYARGPLSSARRAGVLRGGDPSPEIVRPPQ
jgi:GT2 family glycosyltransferase